MMHHDCAIRDYTSVAALVDLKFVFSQKSKMDNFFKTKNHCLIVNAATGVKLT